MKYDPNEFIVTVFGSGCGESIVIHIGNNDWIIIDSCLDPNDKIPCAIKYLNSLEVDIATSVKHIFASHWDKDHIQGLSDILRLSESATFHLSAAMRKSEFLVLLKGQQKLGGLSAAAVEEYNKIIEILAERKKANASSYPMEFELESRLVREDDIFFNSKRFKRKLFSLSPSEAAVQKGLKEIANLIQEPGNARVDITRLVNKNHTSIVLWVEVGETRLLLGSDLEELRLVDDGWENILNLRTRPSEVSQFFKIPHHGSETGHHDRVWQEMLEQQTPSAQTTFNNGNVHLPKIEDIDRIKNLSKESYIAGNLILNREVQADFDRDTDKALKRLSMEVKRNKFKIGRVTFRKRIDIEEDWHIDIEGEVHKTQDIAA